MVEDRKALGTTRKDIFTFLYDTKDDKGSKLTNEELNTNSHITIAAGSGMTRVQ
jgi:cytochrome P450